MAEDTTIPFSQYQSHKKVWAAKITYINLEGNEKGPEGSEDKLWLKVLDRDDREMDLYVASEVFARGVPEVGDYFVVYDDNYQSWSPAKAFEGGYTRIHGDSAPDLFIWMQNWLRAYAEHHEGFDADEVMNWILQQPMTTA